MDLRVLQYFLTLAREESISAAAKFLHLTQPTLSRQLMELEKELGVTLFIRGKRTITLTNEGTLLRKRAAEITELVQKTQNEITSSDEFVCGEIHIGSGETHAMCLIAAILKDLQMENPQIQAHIFSGNAENVTELLDKGLLDFGVLIQSTNINKYQSLHLPVKDTWGVLMRKDSPLATKKNIEPRDLWDVPLLTSKQRLVNGDIAKWIKKDYEKLNIVATYNLIYNASLMVEEGMGYALALDKLVNTSGDSSLCFRPLNPPLDAGMDIVWKKYQVFSKASELFLNRIQNLFA